MWTSNSPREGIEAKAKGEKRKAKFKQRARIYMECGDPAPLFFGGTRPAAAFAFRICVRKSNSQS